MHRRAGFIFCLSLTGGWATPLEGQSLTETAYARALDVVAVAAHCRAPGACAPGSASAVVASFAEDPFSASTVPTRKQLDDALQEWRKTRDSSTTPSGDNPLKLSNTSWVGGSRIAWSVADFVATRAKAELVQSAFRDLTTQLKKSPLDVLLQKSNAVLAASEDTHYRTLLPTLRAAFREDFRGLPSRLGELSAGAVPDGSMRSMLARVSRLSRAYQRIDAGEDPLVVVSEWGELPDSAIWRVERRAGTVALEARAIASFGSGSDLGSSLEAMVKNEQLRNVFVAMLLESLGERESHKDRRAQSEAVERIVRIFDAARSVTDNLARASGTGLDDAERFSARMGAVDGIGEILQLSARDPAEIKATTIALTAAAELWTAVETKDYPRIVVLAVSLLRSQQTTSESTAVPVRLLSFAAAVAAAESSEDVENALTALADPVGSFRGRRADGAVAVALVSYVGGSWGNERVIGGSKKDGVPFIGVAAPVGVELSWGTGMPLLRSVGVNLSVVDVGALLSYRLKGDESVDPGDGGGASDVKEDPAVRWDNVLAPSVMLTLGLTRDYPFTFGIGLQRAPRLRTLDSGDRVTARRVFVMLGVDLTLLKF